MKTASSNHVEPIQAASTVSVTANLPQRPVAASVAREASVGSQCQISQTDRLGNLTILNDLKMPPTFLLSSSEGMRSPPLTKVPLSALVPMSLSLYEGLQKYGHYCHYSVEPDLYVNAALRHLAKFSAGMDLEPDTHYHPLGAVMSSCGIILNAIHKGLYQESRPQVLMAQANLASVSVAENVLDGNCIGKDSLQLPQSNDSRSALTRSALKSEELAVDVTKEQPLENQHLHREDPKKLSSSSKVPLSLVNLSMIVPLASALLSISEEAGEDIGFWRNEKIDLCRYLDRIEVLLYAFNEGQDLHADGLHILAHVIALCAIVIDAQDVGMVNDDRIKDSSSTGAQHSFDLLEMARGVMEHLFKSV